MSKLEHALSGLAPKLTPQWTVDRAKAVERAMALRRRRRTITARLGVAAAVTCTLLVALAWPVPSRGANERPNDVLASSPQLPVATNPLQASISRVDSHTTLELLSLDDRETHVALKAGGAWFDLAPATTARSMAVNVGEVEVSFRATRVLVEQLEHGARVVVERGETEVRWASGRAHLRAGEAGVFHPPVAPPLPPLPGIESSADEWSPYRAPPVSQNQPKAASPVLKRDPIASAVETTPDIPSPPRDLRDAPTRLLDDADSARASGQPEKAVTPLRTLLERYPTDPRAPVAAFTLGRVLLENLHRPAEAADAFAAGRQLAPQSVLFEDALAREVEAADKAGDSRRATLLAVDYLARFPAGARVKAVREYGGLK